jgi:hypothetical protein
VTSNSRVYILILLCMWSLPAPCYLALVEPNYFPEYPIIKHPVSVFLLSLRQNKLHNWLIYRMVKKSPYTDEFFPIQQCRSSWWSLIKPFPELSHHLGHGLSRVLSLVNPHTCHQALLDRYYTLLPCYLVPFGPIYHRLYSITQIIFGEKYRVAEKSPYTQTICTSDSI